MPGVRGGPEPVYVEGPTPMKRQVAEALGFSNVLPGRPCQGGVVVEGLAQPSRRALVLHTRRPGGPNRGMNGYDR